jgi:hypothetical protein
MLVECSHEGCDKKFSLETIGVHEQFDCDFRMVECPNEKCSLPAGQKIPAKLLAIHLEHECGQVMVDSLPCGLCGKMIKTEALEDHMMAHQLDSA